MKFRDDFDALQALFLCSQSREDAQRRYDEAKRDLRNAKEIQAEIVARINDHVRDRREAQARKKLLDDMTTNDALNELRDSLGMPKFGTTDKKRKDSTEN